VARDLAGELGAHWRSDYNSRDVQYNVHRGDCGCRSQLRDKKDASLPHRGTNV
jgi:hypothetical protein